MPRTRSQEEDTQNSATMKIDVSISSTRNYHESPERARAQSRWGIVL